MQSIFYICGMKGRSHISNTRINKSIMKKASIFTLLVAVIMLVGTQSFAQLCFEGPDGTPINAEGQDCTNTIITAVPFLRIAPDARSGAMGDAGIAISADANAIHYNASKLVFAEKDLGVSVTYTPWLRSLGLNDIYMAYLAGYKQIDDISTVGLGLRYFSLGDIQFTDASGNPTGSNRPNEFAVDLIYARKFGDNFSAGIGLKYIYSNLANGQTVNNNEIQAGSAIAGDINLTYRMPFNMGDKDARFVAGLALSNIGPKISYTKSINKDAIPTNFGLGTALEVDIDEFNAFTFTVDVNKLLVPSPQLEFLDENGTPNPDYDPNGDGIPEYKQESPIGAIFSSWGDAPGGFGEEMREFMVSVGAEYWYDQQFAVRAGYYTEHATKGNRKFFTVGLGLKYNIFGLNFSYLVPTSNQRNPLDNTLRFSLLFDFGAFEPDDL